MSISEQVGFLDDAINGHVKVQLIEQDKVVQEVEADNFVGRATYNWLLALLSSSFFDFFRDGSAAYGASSAALVAPQCLTNFYLTDNTSPVPVSSYRLPGNMIGYVAARPYSGGDNTRGTVNPTESGLLSMNKMRIVMDFATHAGNGTFQTLGFGGIFSSPQNYGKPGDLFSGMLSVNASDGKADIDMSSGYAIALSSSILRVLNLTNKTEESYSYSGMGVSQCCIRGTTGYLLNSSTREVWSVDITNPQVPVSIGTIASLPSNFTTNGTMKTDGTHLYLLGTANSNSNKYISAFLISNLSAVRNNVSFSTSGASDFPNDAFRYSSSLHSSGGTTYLTESNGCRVNLTNFIAVGTGASLGATNTGRFLGSAQYLSAIDSDGNRYSSPLMNRPFLSADRESAFNSIYPFIKEENISLLNLGTCVVLPTPVTKTSEQTMKITYELTFNFK